MRRARLLALLAGGLSATGRADEPGWKPAAVPAVEVRPAAPPPPTPPPVVAPAPAPSPAVAPPQPLPPAVRPVAGPTWVKPSDSSGPLWAPSAPLVPVAAQPPKPADDPPRPPSKPLPLPKKLPPEAAPPPTPVVPMPELPSAPKPEEPKKLPAPQPRPVTPSPSQPPAPQPTDPSRTPAPAAAPAPHSPLPAPHCPPELEPHPGVLPAGAVLPARRGVVGSPELTLSRDGSALDLFGAGLVSGEADTRVLGEAAATDRAFASVEYLLWWARPAGVPVLASTAAGRGNGYLGEPGTQTLLGPGSFGSTSRNGFRARAGTWFDDGPVGGLDGGFFFLGEQNTAFEARSDRFPTIARPIFAANLNREFAELVAFPGLSTGRLVAETDSSLWGADVNARACLCRGCDRRAELFAGYRHLNLREGLSVTEFIQSGPDAPDPPGTNIVVNDTFRTRNRFHGGQIGWAASRRYGRLDLSARASVALGGTHQEIQIRGSQVRQRPGQQADVFSGGLLAAGPNLGNFDRTRFSVVPEVSLNVGAWLTPRVKVFTGYNFLYWTNVLRPGDQIDRVIDLTFVPNAPPLGFVADRPLPTLRQTDLWVQGVQFGLEVRW